jgi:hypothetical protein
MLPESIIAQLNREIEWFCDASISCETLDSLHESMEHIIDEGYKVGRGIICFMHHHHHDLIQSSIVDDHTKRNRYTLYRI